MADAALTPLIAARARLDPENYRRIVAQGLRTVRAASWEGEMETIAAFFKNL